MQYNKCTTVARRKSWQKVSKYVSVKQLSVYDLINQELLWQSVVIYAISFMQWRGRIASYIKLLTEFCSRKQS